jgi:hypothetical protein
MNTANKAQASIRRSIDFLHLPLQFRFTASSENACFTPSEERININIAKELKSSGALMELGGYMIHGTCAAQIR